MSDQPDIEIRSNVKDVDWTALKAAVAADNFDNGRTPEQLRASFKNSHAVCIAWSDGRIISTARVLSDGVCNAYLVDVWTASRFRSRGIASQLIQCLLRSVPGQHVYLQSDPDTADFYRGLGFAEQPIGMSQVIGEWLQKDSAKATK